MKKSVHEDIKRQFTAAADLLRESESSLSGAIADAAEIMVNALKSGNTVFLCGNGGSAADAQHIAAELVGRYKLERRGLPALALTTDTSILTSVGNDYGYTHIFSRQIEALGKPGDVLVGISTSGSSANVVEALKEAEKRGMKRIVLIGRNPGSMSAGSDVVIAVPSDDTPRIQEVHAVIGHLLCGIIETELFG